VAVGAGKAVVAAWQKTEARSQESEENFEHDFALDFLCAPLCPLWLKVWFCLRVLCVRSLVLACPGVPWEVSMRSRRMVQGFVLPQFAFFRVDSRPNKILICIANDQILAKAQRILSPIFGFGVTPCPLVFLCVLCGDF
jgi:hypothetical protein